MTNHLAPLLLDIRQALPALPKNNDDLERTVFLAPFPCKVIKVAHTADGAIVGGVNHYRQFTILNRGPLGTGSLAVAQLTFYPETSDPFAEREIPLIPGSVDLAQGDVLTFQSMHLGTGIQDPGGKLHIVVSRTGIPSV